MKDKKIDVRKIDIGISEEHRIAIAKGLSKLLADSFTLYLMTHNFHWNVTGPMFNTLHTMFMDQYTEQWNALDVIAERIRALLAASSDPQATYIHVILPAKLALCQRYVRERSFGLDLRIIAMTLGILFKS